MAAIRKGYFTSIRDVPSNVSNAQIPVVADARQ
jgi:hypothetical protein